MELYKVDINKETYKVAIADNQALREKGLSGLEKLGVNKGMLFIYPDKMDVVMVMRDMNFGLDFLFLDKDWSIVQVGQLSSDPSGYIESENPVYMVMELPLGTIKKEGISVGDIVKPSKEIKTQFKGVVQFKHGGKFEMIGDKVYEVIEDDIKVDPSKLQILNDKGEVVSNIKSGSRVFSRVHTKEMIEKHKKGNKIELADMYLDIIDIQDKQKPEYVKK